MHCCTHFFTTFTLFAGLNLCLRTMSIHWIERMNAGEYHWSTIGHIYRVIYCPKLYGHALLWWTSVVFKFLCILTFFPPLSSLNYLLCVSMYHLQFTVQLHSKKSWRNDTSSQRWSTDFHCGLMLIFLLFRPWRREVTLQWIEPSIPDPNDFFPVIRTKENSSLFQIHPADYNRLPHLFPINWQLSNYPLSTR